MIKKNFRVEGYDLLRGLAALGVAVYHIHSWSGIPAFRNLGTYGVYVFFILSGASLYLAYGQRILSGAAIEAYFARRFFRIFPLYFVAMLLTHFWLNKEITLTGFVINASLLFGLGNPGTNSSITGGWSLGIEFVFYLIFPIFAAIRIKSMAILFILLGVVQFCFLKHTLKDSLSTDWAAYVEPLSFVAYFAGGVLIQRYLILHHSTAEYPSNRWFVSVFMAVLVFLTVFVITRDQEDFQLKGVAGLGFFALCFVLVICMGSINLPRVLARLALVLGQTSYGIYLLHPIVFSKLASSAVGSELTFLQKLTFTLITTFSLAYVLYHLIEKPLLRYSKNRFPVEEKFSQQAPGN